MIGIGAGDRNVARWTESISRIAGAGELVPRAGVLDGGPTPDPNRSPCNVVAPTQEIGEINGSSAPPARQSNALPWDRIDQVPHEISDVILYALVHGAKAQPPPPGPNASPVGQARAAAVRSALARHANVRTLLAGAVDG